MFRLTVLVCFLCVAASEASKHEAMAKIFKKYGTKKIFESCFGEEPMKQLYEKIYHSMQHCREELDAPPKPPTEGPAMDEPYVHRVPAKPAFDWAAFFNGVEGRSTGPRSNMPDYFFNRQKRHAHDHHTHPGADHTHPVPFHEAKIRAAKDTMLRNLKLGACVLQKCEVLDDKLEMNWTAIAKHYNEIQAAPELKEDLVEVLDQCKKFVTCYHPGSYGNFPAGIKQALTFIECEKKKKALACLKQDLRKNPTMFELSGLDGVLDGSDYNDPDEQMLKVLFLEQKYGDNDFAIFE